MKLEREYIARVRRLAGLSDVYKRKNKCKMIPHIKKTKYSQRSLHQEAATGLPLTCFVIHLIIMKFDYTP